MIRVEQKTDTLYHWYVDDGYTWEEFHLQGG